MTENQFPPFAIAALSLVCMMLILGGLNKAMILAGWPVPSRRKTLWITTALFLIWLLTTGILSNLGYFSDFSSLPPKPVLVILLPLPVILWISFTEKFSRLLLAVPATWLLYMQTFRIAVELILYSAFMLHLLPEQMTFSGFNFDILAGLLALPVGIYCSRRNSGSPKIVLAYNILGLLLLLNVLLIALFSMPIPIRQFMKDPSTAIVGSFPFIYLPAVLVVTAYSLHIFSLRHYFIHRKPLLKP